MATRPATSHRGEPIAGFDLRLLIVAGFSGYFPPADLALSVRARQLAQIGSRDFCGGIEAS
jgi:hypothetical protein